MNQRGREFLESVNASYRAAGGGWQGGLLYGVVYWFVRGYNRHLHPDADNISKPIWDVLKKGGAYDDDRQVCLRIAAVVDLSSERGARGTLTEPFDLTFAPPVVADAIEGLASREARGGQTSASTTGFVYIEVGALDRGGRTRTGHAAFRPRGSGRRAERRSRRPAMKIEPAILAPYLKAAAVDQLAFDLETQGFTVKRKGTGSDDERHFDLVARRGGETGFYVVRVAGQRHGPQEMPLSMLTKDLRLKNGRFHLVVVRPERGTDVSVSGLADALRRSLSSDQTGELRRSSNHLSVEGVDGVEIERIEVRHGGEIDVTGTAVLTLSQAAEQAHGEPAREQVPFGFRAAIGPDGSVLNDPAPEYKFDWSEWREEQVEGMGLSRDG